MNKLVNLIFRMLSVLPLPFLHSIGRCLGSLNFYLSAKNSNLIRNHLNTAGLPADDAVIKEILQETAKSGLELPVAFFRKPEDIAALFHQVYGWEHIQTALNNKEGLLLVTPHLGSYDLAGRYISHYLPFPLTAMYKPPKIKAFDKVMQAGRVRGNGRTAPTNMQGVKQIIKALRSCEAVVLLPDHVPDPKEGGEGVWADFFGRPAYTMTLAAKLAQVKGVRTLFFCAERLQKGKGFILHIEPLQGELTGDKAHDAKVINENVEYWIKRFPKQYLFAYNRYKHPAGAPFPPSEAV